MSNLWSIQSGTKNIKTHGATFPVELAEIAIANFTDIGSVILDPFMGTGTTGVACKNLGSYFIGIEKDDYYFQIAKERITQETAHA